MVSPARYELCGQDNHGQEREIDDARSIRDAGASEKKRENQSFFSSGKKQRTSASRGFQGQGRGYQG